MPRCYMVKKASNRYSGWGAGSSPGEPAARSRPQSPTGGSVAPPSPEPPIYRPLSTVITSTTHSYLHDLMPESHTEAPQPPCATEVSSDGGIPIFRMRSAEETEAAHDLLELSRSLPPLAPPGIATYQPNDSDHITLHYRYEPAEVTSDEPGEEQEYTTIPSSTASPPPPSSSAATSASSTGGGSSGNAYRPTIICYTPLQQHPAPPSPSPPLTPSYTSVQILYQPPSPAPSSCYTSPSTQPLTPPTSEYSSDAENNNPNPQHQNGTSVIQTVMLGSPPQHHHQSAIRPCAVVERSTRSGDAREKRDKSTETATHVAVPSKTPAPRAVYTYDALRSTDGRSKRNNKKKKPAASEEEEDEEEDESGEMSVKKGRYVCGECGKRYATSSNLSRHKQTHRSLDSGSARQCNVCGKAYVSMPALAMHVLTHQLTHACGVCGKLFSRPWLLQGHLRSHTGEKPYGCAHCGKAFADRSNLRAHMQTHTQDKSYSCHRCHKNFALKSYLNKHLESSCSKEDDFDEDEDRPITPI